MGQYTSTCFPSPFPHPVVTTSVAAKDPLFVAPASSRLLSLRVPQPSLSRVRILLLPGAPPSFFEGGSARCRDERNDEGSAFAFSQPVRPAPEPVRPAPGAPPSFSEGGSARKLASLSSATPSIARKRLGA